MGEKARYRVDQRGHSGDRALVTDVRSHEIVLSLQGPDRFVVADAVAAVLNASWTETPVATRRV